MEEQKPKKKGNIYFEVALTLYIFVFAYGTVLSFWYAIPYLT